MLPCVRATPLPISQPGRRSSAEPRHPERGAKRGVRRFLMNPYQGQHNGSMGAFGWTGGSGTWAEADPSEGVSIVYMHNLQPNLEEYHHLRMRAVAYGCLH